MPADSAWWIVGPAVLPSGWQRDAAIAITGDRIGWAGPRVAAPCSIEEPVTRLAPQQFVAPGFIDLHCHGGGGAAFGSDRAEAVRAAQFHHASGSTSVMASLVSAAPRTLLAAAAVCGSLASHGDVLGVHVEGPFLSPARCGAHDPRALLAIDLDLVRELADAAAGQLTVMTYAPELARADELCAELVDLGVLPAIGHTDASAHQTSSALALALAQGRRPLVTHLFNAMPAWQSRAPGPAAAALAAAARGQAVVELIADGVHLDDATVAALFAVAAPGSVALVSDAIAAAGAHDGRYRLGALDVVVTDLVARLADGATLAGGTSTLAQIVRRCVRAGLDVSTVISAATTTPAAVLGLEAEIGALDAGLRADLVVLDDGVTVRHVLRSGRWIGSAPA